MSAKTDKFINGIAPLVVNEYLSRDKWILPSVCIAQGALESGWNLEAKSLFGIKGEGFKATTSEYYNGHMVTIEDSFRDFGGVANSVVGYYDFLRDTPRYSGALNNSDYKDTVDKLIHTTDGAPYATDPDYISKIISIIEDYDLTRFDIRLESGESFNVGDKVTVLNNVTYDGKSFTKYFDKYEVIEVKGDRVVIGIEGVVTCAINAKDIKKVSVGVVSGSGNDIVVGDKVEVLKAEQYNGGAFDTWHKYYDVIERNGDRVVIGVGDVVTCAINVNNLKKV